MRLLELDDMQKPAQGGGTKFGHEVGNRMVNYKSHGQEKSNRGGFKKYANMKQLRVRRNH